MYKIAILLSGLLISLAFTISAQDDWKHYNFDEYNFEIDFFQEPDFSTDSSSFNDFSLVSYFWELNVPDTIHKNNYYSIILEAYPESYIHSDSLLSSVEDFINSTQNSLLEDDTYTLLSSSLLEKDGFPGKEFRWKTNDNVFFRFQTFLVENKLFQLSVVSREGENHNIYINKFLNSFKLVDIPNGNFQIPKKTFERTISVKFPGNPKEEIKNIDSDYGKLTLDVQMLEPTSKDDNMIYIAMETRYPSNVVDQNDTYALNSFYKKSIDGALNSINGELISINDIFYKGKLGKEIKCYFSNGQALITYRFFIVDDKLFTLGVITQPDNDKNKAMNKFFESFAIKK